MSFEKIRRFLTAKLARLKDQYVGVDWYWLVLPITISALFILSVGPSLQATTFPVIDSQRAGIYQSVYNEEIADLPSLSGWLIQAFDSRFLTIAILSVVISLWAKNFKATMMLFGVSVAIGFSVFDVFIYLLFPHPQNSPFVTSMIANAVGGALAAGMWACSVIMMRLIWEAAKDFGNIGKAIAAAFPPIFGIFVSSFVYYAVYILYQPLPSRIELIASVPSSGMFSQIPKAKSNKTRAGAASPFDFVPDTATKSALLLDVPRGSILADWHALKDAPSVRVEVRAYGGCFFEKISELPKSKPIIVIPNTRQFAAGFGPGYSKFYYEPETSAKYSVSVSELSFFDVDKSKDSKSLEVTHFLGKEEVISAENIGSYQFAQIAFLLSDSTEKKGKRPLREMLAARTWSAKFGTEGYRVTVNPSLSITSKTKLKCHAIQSKDIMSGSDNSMQVMDIAVAFLVSVKPLESDSGNLSYDGKMQIKEANGWVHFEGIPIDEGGSNGGDLSMVAIWNNIAELSVDGEKLDVKKFDDVTLRGELKGELLEGGALRISGEAETAWKSSRRLNFTKWERLGTEWKLAIVAGFFSTLFALFRFGWPNLIKLKDQDLRTWLG